ncbi:MAG: UDP-N-acetylmuramate:L-alanyl-gamma-D-glutamyl-meso-diaminopimelate ligase [Coxiellaceae bacterium]|nr:UDP-N-acetylmuramate:L-alanyl-gamma-D-glutamyl-meso-diaminopimelate ligase [Coxiellaceae bacterium]|tara:strand:- start:1502 stop:2851 length:1350 start_codon:yes stop_codon:yes gene_type:complete
MRIHIVGIAGTFMAGVALIAREMGYQVSGCDDDFYPPMSDVLANAGVDIMPGYDVCQLSTDDDWIIIGNAYSRGHPYIEAILNGGYRYCSGPEWLARYVLCRQHVLAVSGTHGKTTTSSVLAWLLESADLSPSFLIGGSPKNFSQPARWVDSRHFVIEADEYDTAFFDKRSKFVHYRPDTLIINNLEYDHADIFPDLSAIQTQFHHVVRTVPSHGRLIVPTGIEAINTVLQRGVWSPLVTFGQEGDWQAKRIADDGSQFELWYHSTCLGTVTWGILGVHNVANALSACAAAVQAGVLLEQLVPALISFQGVRRRMEYVLQHRGLTIFDDFAHHPTAIASALRSLRAKVNQDPITVFLECGSRTMQSGVHQNELVQALSCADHVMLLDHQDMQWDVTTLREQLSCSVQCYDSVETMFSTWQPDLDVSQSAILMSNKSFDGFKEKCLARYT